MNGNVGVVAWEYGRLRCFICDQSCVHEKFAKDNQLFQTEQHEAPPTAQTTDDNLFSSMQPSVFLSNDQKLILKTRLNGFPQSLINGTRMHYAMEDMREKCLFCNTVFDYSLENKKFKIKYYISRDEFVPVAGLYIFIIILILT